MTRTATLSPLENFQLGAALSTTQFSAISTPVVPGLGEAEGFDLHPQPLETNHAGLDRFLEWCEHPAMKVFGEGSGHGVMTLWGESNVFVSGHEARHIGVSVPRVGDRSAAPQMAFRLTSWAGGDLFDLFFMSRQLPVSIRQRGRTAVAREPGEEHTDSFRSASNRMVIDAGGKFLERAGQELVAAGDWRWKGILETLAEGRATPLTAMGIVLFFTQEFAIKGTPRELTLKVEERPERTLAVKRNGVVELPASLGLSELTGAKITFRMREPPSALYNEGVQVEYIPAGRHIPIDPFVEEKFSSSRRRYVPCRWRASSPCIHISQDVTASRGKQTQPFAFAAGDLVTAAAKIFPGFPLRPE